MKSIVVIAGRPMADLLTMFILYFDSYEYVGRSDNVNKIRKQSRTRGILLCYLLCCSFVFLKEVDKSKKICGEANRKNDLLEATQMNTLSNILKEKLLGLERVW